MSPWCLPKQWEEVTMVNQFPVCLVMFPIRNQRGGGPRWAAAHPIFEGKTPWGRKNFALKKNLSRKEFLLPTQSKIRSAAAMQCYKVIIVLLWAMLFLMSQIIPSLLLYIFKGTYIYRAKKSYLDMGVLKKIDFQWENRQIRKIFTWLDTLVGRQFRFTFCDVLTSYASCYYTIYIIRYLLYQLIFYTVIL